MFRLRVPRVPRWPQFTRNLSGQTLEVVKATLPAVAAAGPKFTGHFYQRMFAAHPELLNVFNVTNQRQGRQQKALFSAVAACATNVLEEGKLPLELLEGVNHKHCALNVIPAQYDVVGEHLIGTIVDLMNPGQEVLDAWTELYTVLAGECVKREEELYKEAESKPGGWRGKRKFKMTKKDVKSHQVTEFVFASADGQPVCSFNPGQYITVWAQPEENMQPRHYSIIESQDNSFRIAVKKEPHGLVSGFLHDRSGVGDEFDLSPPFGNFSIAGTSALWLESNPVVLISAGVGITPMLAMLGSLKNGVTPDKHKVLWLHAAQNGKEHAFRDYLVGLARAHPEDLVRRVWYSDPLPDDFKADGNNNAPYHFDGLMNLSQVKDQLPLGDPDALYFFCGPIPWMRDIGHQLLDLGVPKGALNFEVFGPSDDIL
ncbi:unnamed protein product [Effrenium voratum]|uniref:nitric oxide dioxygenase n=1 Tax=Effrenium voratum TaxID=2562239 RepID=A0AA36NEC8_9DINO|nr:unnamed protein product [Effrenium voratum]CAJ1403129.1 unnamed protein product [Effrenium voratum]